MVDIIIENSHIMNINASVPIAESDAAECNDDIGLWKTCKMKIQMMKMNQILM